MTAVETAVGNFRRLPRTPPILGLPSRPERFDKPDGGPPPLYGFHILSCCIAGGKEF
jgi:hypothetical protein